MTSNFANLSCTIFYQLIATPQVHVVAALRWLPNSTRSKTINLYFTHSFDTKLLVSFRTYIFLPEIYIVAVAINQ